jgi:hypothetical protein
MSKAEPRTLLTVLTFVRRALLTLAGVVGGLFAYFVCQGMFSGYPQYGTGVLSYIGLFLICATGGLAWFIDQRRIDDDDV